MKNKLLSITVFLFCCLSMVAKNTLSNEKTPLHQLNLIKSVNPLPTSLAKITLCEGEKLAITAEDAGTGATYEWTKGTVVKSNNEDLIINPITLADTGIYTLTVTKNGCTNTADIEVKINKKPAVPTLRNTVATCSANGSTKITNYDATLTYIFTDTATNTIVNTIIIKASGEIENMVIGTSYTVKAERNTCISTNSTAFDNKTMLPAPKAIIKLK
ncbi:hypothetical protein LNI98_06880 [Tenacibaculum dicentrarchi]|nr:hypothetical protein [Tenacibaculum dicentrarchi]MCD8437399.1 hypothetical protein [Tenacibaculum dicentrarchi]MCD8449415.1 hypothetical protein [Tenacibaculum dicentrarchi]MCG8838259.1 hypothetical protein [Tenacibaculum dicentrarchi]MDB0615880.1 hypothetical protein [Tenacibaculum dicentrarchi]